MSRIVASLLMLMATASTCLAAGAVSLNRNSCTGPINLDTTGGGPVNAYVSVLGQSQVAQAYQCITVGHATGAPMRDAWRFDPASCNSGFFALNHTAPATVAKTCPSFQGNLQSLQIKDYAYDPLTGWVRITLANAYPNNGLGNPGAVNPAQRYFLANYVFDLTFSVPGAGSPGATCGGVEAPTCWFLNSTSWLDNNGIETPWALASEYLTTNDPNNSAFCPFGPDPAAPRTWGSIKSQYRN